MSFNTSSDPLFHGVPDNVAGSRSNSDPVLSRSAPVGSARKRQLEYDRAVIDSQTKWDQRLARAAYKGELVFLLDIDKCSVLGEDTGDILRVIQNLSEIEKSPEILARLTSSLVNDSLIDAVQRFQALHKYTPCICIYTARGAVVDLGYAVKGFDDDLLHDNELLFNGGDITDGPEYILKQVPPKGSMEKYAWDAFVRLAVVSWAVAYRLGLPYTPPVIVTRVGKSVDRAGKLLHVAPERLWLFDDKAEGHAARLHMSPEEAHMLHVPMYDYVSMPDDKHASLKRRLESEFPLVNTNPTDIKRFATADRHWPAQNLVIDKEASYILGGDAARSMHARPMAPWPLPPGDRVPMQPSEHALFKNYTNADGVITPSWRPTPGVEGARSGQGRTFSR